MWEVKFAPDAKADLKKPDKAFAEQVHRHTETVYLTMFSRADFIKNVSLFFFIDTA